jgi:hypothetical protein
LPCGSRFSEATEAPKTTRVSRNLPKRFWQNLALIAVPAAVLVGVETYHATTILPELARSQAAVAHTFQVIDTERALDEAVQDAERASAALSSPETPNTSNHITRGVKGAPTRLAEFIS